MARRGGTDYSKFDKIDYAALGADDDDLEQQRRARGTAQRADEEAEPEHPQKALLRHAADVEYAKKRLAELEEEQKAAELKLLKLAKERKVADRIFMVIGVLFSVLVALTYYLVQSSSSSSSAYGTGAKAAFDDVMAGKYDL